MATLLTTIQSFAEISSSNSKEIGRLLPEFIVLWRPIDHLLNFNLKIRLPLDLKSLYKLDANGKFPLDLFQPVDEFCTQTIQDGIILWRILIKERATLTRYENRVIIQKSTSEVSYKGTDRYPSVERTEFQIEVTNIKTVSFKDIIFPPLYAFCEEVHLLPNGIDFLKIFLMSPSSYLQSLLKK